MTVHGTKDFAAAAPIQTSPRNRRCAQPGCHTRLSVFNHGRYCVIHEVIEIRTDQTKKRCGPKGSRGTHVPRHDGTAKTCAHCGYMMPRTAGFWRPDRRSADGLHSWCRACHRDARRELAKRKRSGIGQKRARDSAGLFIGNEKMVEVSP